MLTHVSRTDGWSDKNIAQKGFTLVELLVVIIILGVLAAVVIFAVGNTTENATDNSCNVERRTLRTAVEAWRLDDAHPDNGNPNAQDLLDDNLIDELPENYTVNGNTITATAAGNC